MARAAREANVAIVTGDTKVVEQGKGDGVFITTTGVGVVDADIDIGGARARPGDAILLSGFIGDQRHDHHVDRESLAFGADLRSDTAALHGLVAAMLDPVRASMRADPGRGIHALRDPTRGGLATLLNEIAGQSGVGMLVEESRSRCGPQVECGLRVSSAGPLYVANEGKLVAVVAAEDAEAVLAAMRAHTARAEAARIGAVTEDRITSCRWRRRFGGRRVVDWLTGEQLPRIC